RAEARALPDRPVLRGRPRGGDRRSAHRQVHHGAHDPDGPRARTHPAGGAVLRAGLRRRIADGTGRAAAHLRDRRPPRRRRGAPRHQRGRLDPGQARGVLPPPRHRLDRHLPGPPGPRRTARRALRRRVPVVDGWATLRADFETLEQDILEIAQRGLGFGVHVIITAARWPEIRPQLKDAINTRIELRLGDPMESDIDRKVAVNVPTGTPGRGLTKGKLHFLGALPRIDGVEDPTDLADGVAKAVHAIADAWQGPAAPKLRMLPLMVPYTELPAPAARPNQVVPLGVDETKLEPVYLDFNADPHFLLFGEGESGKTSVLRTLVQGITE